MSEAGRSPGGGSASMAAHRPGGRTAWAAVARMVVAGACWGLSAVIAKIAFDRGVPPVRMAEARVVVAFVLLATLLGWRRRDLLRAPRPSWTALAGFGLSVAAVNVTYYVAIDRLAVGVAISLQYTAPVLLLGLAAVATRRIPARVVWAAAAMTLAGAVLVSRAYAGLGDVDTLGLAAAVGSSFSFGGYLLTAGRAGDRGVPPATVLFWGFVVAMVAWSVVAPWWSWPWGRLADPKVLWSVLGVGVVGTLIPFFLAVGAVPVLRPAVAGIAATVEPPFAAAFAWVFLGQRLSGVQMAGGVLVVAGVILAHRSRAVRPEALTFEPAT